VTLCEGSDAIRYQRRVPVALPAYSLCWIPCGPGPSMVGSVTNGIMFVRVTGPSIYQKRSSPAWSRSATYRCSPEA